MAKPILILAALAALWPAAAGAQARLNGDQLAYRMLHPDCVFPDLQHNPDFRLCGRHFLGDAGIAVIKHGRYGTGLSIKMQDFDGEPYAEQEPYPAAVSLDSAWLVVDANFNYNYQGDVPPDDIAIAGNHSLSIAVRVYARDAAARAVTRTTYPVVAVPPRGLNSYAEGTRCRTGTAICGPTYDVLNARLARDAAIYGCASVDECLAAYSWFYASSYYPWGALTNAQMTRVARVIQLRIVNDACNVGLSAQAPSDVVVLTMREDGRISGRCEPRPPDEPYRPPCWYPDRDRNSGLCIGQPEPEPEGDRP